MLTNKWHMLVVCTAMYKKHNKTLVMAMQQWQEALAAHRPVPPLWQAGFHLTAKLLVSFAFAAALALAHTADDPSFSKAGQGCGFCPASMVGSAARKVCACFAAQARHAPGCHGAARLPPASAIQEVQQTWQQQCMGHWSLGAPPAPRPNCWRSPCW